MTIENWIAIGATAGPIILIMLRMMVIQSRNAKDVADILHDMRNDMRDLRDLHMVKGNLCAMSDTTERHALVDEMARRCKGEIKTA